MTTAAKLWLGFGLLTTILVLSSLAIIFRVRSTETDVSEMANVALPRRAATRQMEVHVLGYALAVRAHLQKVNPAARLEAVAERENVENYLSEYRLLAATDRQREMASRFSSKWGDFKQLGETLLDAGDAASVENQSKQFYENRTALVKFLNDEIQADAIGTYDLIRDATLVDLQTISRLSIIFLVAGIFVSVVTSWAVGRGILATERFLRESEERTRSVIDNVIDGIISFDVRGNVRTFNPAAEKLFGYSSKEIIGQNVKSLMPEPYHGEYDGYLANYLQTGEAKFIGSGREVVGLNKDGSAFPMELAVSEFSIGTERFFTGIVRDITERKTAEEAMRQANDALEERIEQQTRVEIAIRESEERYRRLFDSIDEGFCIIEMIFDNSGNPVDYRFVQANPAMERLTGLRNALGKTARELVPDIEDFWIKTYGSVALTGEPVRFQNRSEPMNRWFDVYASRLGDADRGLVAIVFNNITERKQEETRLALLARLGEITRTTEDANALLFAVANAVGQSFNVRRCLFNEIDLENNLEMVHRDYCRGAKSVAGKRKLSNYSPRTLAEMTAGKTVVNSDSESDPRTAAYYKKVYGPSGRRAYVAVPLMRGGRWVASLWLSDDKPRNWTNEEVILLDGIGERAWLAVEKLGNEAALRESEERRKLAQDAGNVGIFDWNILDGRTYWSETMWTIYGEAHNDVDPDPGFWSSHIYAGDRERVEINIRNVINSDSEELRDEFRITRPDGSIRWIEALGKVVRNDAGIATRMYGVNLDISERKTQEEDLKRAHDQLEIRVQHRTKQLAESNIELLKQMEDREIAERQRIDLLRRLVTGQEMERRRIARDLHDQLGQRLTALRLKIASLMESAVENVEFAERVKGLQEIAERLDSEVSFLAWELRPTALDDLGLVEAVGAFVNEWSKHAEISADFHSASIPEERLERETETHLYRITQEALNNIAKHAGANHVSVLLEKRNEGLTLIIEDDGAGFDPAMHRSPSESGHGLGLTGMRERAALIGGEVEIESSPGKGATIYVRVPFST